ncbi:SDR family oxidoreductase [Williamsia soli]|uniref:SDR family oxidoreductase n=1 Tax=Williamsia soli TaxID=364929 RepID=UPI001F4176BB|nr:SDR family oxidoreductase [Williamsia soli]
MTSPTGDSDSTGVYVVTGSASGMGHAVAVKLAAAGHRVIGVDQRDADIVADLSTAQGRRNAVTAVLAAAGGPLAGAVLAAGLGPGAALGPGEGTGRPRLITEVNYFGVVELLEGWRDALAAAEDAKVVVFSSNSTTTVPAVPRRAINALLAGDGDRAVRSLRRYGRVGPVMAYAASKIAVSRWVRRQATSPAWAGAGIRLNALAPGAILTPLLEEQLASPTESRAVTRFPVPIGGFGDPDKLADWAVFMLSDAAGFLCGSVIFVDGGSDAYFRADDWPRAVPLRRLPPFLLRSWRFGRRPG